MSVELAAALLGIIVGTLSMLALIFQLRNYLVKVMKDIVIRALVDVGLVSKFDEPRNVWPDGSEDLPHFLTTLWKSQTWMEARIYELLKQQKPDINLRDIKRRG